MLHLHNAAYDMVISSMLVTKCFYLQLICHESKHSSEQYLKVKHKQYFYIEEYKQAHYTT